MTARACDFCGGSLAGMRRDARYCSPSCRSDANRLRRLLRGETVGRYATPGEYLEVRQSRARSVS